MKSILVKHSYLVNRYWNQTFWQTFLLLMRIAYVFVAVICQAYLIVVWIHCDKARRRSVCCGSIIKRASRVVSAADGDKHWRLLEFNYFSAFCLRATSLFLFTLCNQQRCTLLVSINNILLSIWYCIPFTLSLRGCKTRWLISIGKLLTSVHRISSVSFLNRRRFWYAFCCDYYTYRYDAWLLRINGAYVDLEDALFQDDDAKLRILSKMHCCFDALNCWKIVRFMAW